MADTTPSPKPTYLANPARQVFLLWAIIILVGFTGTQITRSPQINLSWLLAIVLGLGFMKYHMSFKDRRLAAIWLLWLVVLGGGMLTSLAAFHIASLAQLGGYLGVFWLVIMGAGHLINAALDHPRSIYAITGLLQIVVAGILYATPSLLTYQYLIAGLVGSLAMLWLGLFAVRD